MEPNQNHRWARRHAWIAARERDESALIEALAKGAKADEQNQDGDWLLGRVARFGSARAVEALVAHGARVERKDHYGNTPALLAAAAGNAQVLEALLVLGADPCEINKAGCNAASLAAQGSRRHAQCLMALARGGFDFDALDGNGATPLMLAAGAGDGAVAVAFLLSLGVDLEASAAPGEISAAAIAARRGRADSLELLLRSGAALEGPWGSLQGMAAQGGCPRCVALAEQAMLTSATPDKSRAPSPRL